MRFANFRYRPILHATDAKHQTDQRSAYFEHQGFESQATGGASSNYFSHDLRGEKTRFDVRLKPDMSQSLKKPLLQTHLNPAVLNLQQAPMIYKPILASASQSMHLSTALKGQTGHRFNSPTRPTGQQQWGKPDNAAAGKHVHPVPGTISTGDSAAVHKPTADQQSIPAGSNLLDRIQSNTPAKVLADAKQEALSYLSPVLPKDLTDAFEKKNGSVSMTTEMTAEQREEFQQLLTLKTDLLSMISARKIEKESITKVNHMLLKKIEQISQSSHQRLRTM